MQPLAKDSVSLGALIRGHRADHQWTQAELADRAGVSRRFVSELESGSRTGAELSRVLAVVRTLGLGVALLPSESPSFDQALREVLP